MPTINDIFEQMVNNDPFKDRQQKEQPKTTEMWQITVYSGRDLILEHKQNDYGKVLRFAMSSLVELGKNNIMDFRIVMCNKQGHVYFQAIGPTTQIVEFKKKGDIIPDEN